MENIVKSISRKFQKKFFIYFSPDSSLVCVSSSHGTIHLFATEDSSKNKMSSLVSSATDFFGPASNKLLPKYFTSEWSFSKIEVPGGTRCICAFGSNNNTVLAVCDDSSYHKFVYDEQKRQFIREVYQMFLEPDIETVESFWEEVKKIPWNNTIYLVISTCTKTWKFWILFWQL